MSKRRARIRFDFGLLILDFALAARGRIMRKLISRHVNYAKCSEQTLLPRGSRVVHLRFSVDVC